MSENVIFCYSGTGNCLDMTKNIAKVLGDTDIIMMRSRPTVTDVKDAKRVGFVFPCYGGGLPGDVEKFVKLVEVSPDAYTFGVCQFAGYPGNGLHMIDEIVGLDYWAMMSHQCGYIVLFPHQLMVPPMVIIDAVPAPIQTINIGPRAVLGRALSTTRYGSRTLDAKSLHHSPTAMSVPSAVPRVKPAAVSRQDVPTCHPRPVPGRSGCRR